jgi:hypothetical protein
VTISAELGQPELQRPPSASSPTFRGRGHHLGSVVLRSSGRNVILRRHATLSRTDLAVPACQRTTCRTDHPDFGLLHSPEPTPTPIGYVWASRDVIQCSPHGVLCRPRKSAFLRESRVSKSSRRPNHAIDWRLTSPMLIAIASIPERLPGSSYGETLLTGPTISLPSTPSEPGKADAIVARLGLRFPF